MQYLPIIQDYFFNKTKVQITAKL